MGRFINADAYTSTGQGILGNNMFAYCGNNPINMIDITGNSWLAIGIFIGVSTVIGALAGAFTAACTGGNVVEGALEGAALGAVAATATIVTPILLPAASTTAKVGATLVAAAAGGIAVDFTAQIVAHELSENSEDEFVLDKGRLIKTGLTTGIAGVVPTYGTPGESVINAIGSLAMGFDASFINAAIEVIFTNLVD